jgi:hypothetical protein
MRAGKAKPEQRQAGCWVRVAVTHAARAVAGARIGCGVRKTLDDLSVGRWDVGRTEDSLGYTRRHEPTLATNVGKLPIACPSAKHFSDYSVVQRRCSGAATI